MKKVIALLALSATVLSCSNDNDKSSQSKSFFNLKEGNLWVYKRYNVDANGETEQPGYIDTVQVTGKQIINDVSYYKLHHTLQGYHNEIEYRRVDELGHLVDESGLVFHPGTDANYTFTFNKEPYGVLNYKLAQVEQRTIEGHNYTLYPYVGYFTPSEAYGDLPENSIGNIASYDPAIGLIASRASYISSLNTYFEDRLVHYELK